MSPADRETVRLVLDQANTPQDALARRILARPVFEYELDNPLRVDDCEICGAIHWRDCVCQPGAPVADPPLDRLERARDERLTRAERAAGHQPRGASTSERDGQ